jgi:hypothetical protein
VVAAEDCRNLRRLTVDFMVVSPGSFFRSFSAQLDPRAALLACYKS